MSESDQPATTTDRRYRVTCPDCDWEGDSTYGNRLVTSSEADRHDDRVHDGEETATVEMVRPVTDGGLKDVVTDEFSVVSGQISDPDGATAYQALATRVHPEDHPRLQRAGFHDPQTLFVLFSPGGRPSADYDPYKLANSVPGRDTSWVVDQLQALNKELRTEEAEEDKEVCTDGGRDRIHPENLPQDYTPAYVQVSDQGPVFVANYTVLDSNWIAVTEWSGERVKLSPFKVSAVREVQTEYYGETNELGYRSKRIADEDRRDQATSDAEKFAEVGV